MIKTVICDDNEKARYILKEYLKIISIDEIEVVGECGNGYELIEFCKKHKPQLILLDIDMPFINGIDTAKEILEFSPDMSFIFITALSNFSLEAFEVHASDYILKPVSIERLEKSLRYITKSYTKNDNIQDNKYITFTINHTLYTLKLSKVLFIERIDRKTIIHTLTKEFEIYESLDNLEERLDPSLFLRTHNSYIINISSISKINKSGGTYEASFNNYNKPAYISRRNMIKLTKFLNIVTF